jgi:hypothetical protein
MPRRQVSTCHQIIKRKWWNRVPLSAWECFAAGASEVTFFLTDSHLFRCKDREAFLARGAYREHPHLGHMGGEQKTHGTPMNVSLTMIIKCSESVIRQGRSKANNEVCAGERNAGDARQ